MPDPVRKALSLGAALLLAACRVPAVSAGNPPGGQDFTEIERGRYLTSAADCVACHTNPDGGKSFAGGRPIETPFGIVVSANITPDAQTGIGDWTAKQFDDAVRQGKRRDGKRLYPAMPYVYYTKMSAADVQAIRAYLNTIPAVHHDVETNQLPFPFSIRWGMRLWNSLYFEPGPFVADPSRSPAWNRGAYLVEGPGHCGSCHTPKGTFGGDKNKRALQGYSLQGWFAPDITNDERRGLGEWSPADVSEFLRSGHNRFAGAAGPMADEVVHSSSNMTEADLNAIAQYLKSMPGHSSPEDRPLSADNPRMKAGGAIYQDLCAACHHQDGAGVSHLIPNLKVAASVAATEPTSVLRVIIRGTRTAATQSEPTAPAMPGYGWQLTDQQIADVSTYVRNSWGNAASSVSAGDVRAAREDLQARSN
ncbi:MAG: c-type cytochrome [Proteobacteria bacterium]|nr:c-type cytochrome [Pseudomonadota bacterium]